MTTKKAHLLVGNSRDARSAAVEDRIMGLPTAQQPCSHGPYASQSDTADVVSGIGDRSAESYAYGHIDGFQAVGNSSCSVSNPQLKRPLTKRLWHTVSRGPPLVASYFVPDEAREKFSDRSIITMGVSLLFLNVIAFILLIVFYGKCHKTTVLTIHPEEGGMIDIERDCEVEQLLHTEGISMDQRGRWSGEWNFRPAEAFWRFEFVRFRNTNQGFRRNISGVIDKLYDEFEVLKGHRYYEVIQLLRFSNITVDGSEGYVRVAPNFNLQFPIRNKLTDWSQARDMRRWVSLGRPLTREEEALAIRGSRAESCDGTTVVVGYDRLQIKGNRAITVLPTPLFDRTMNYSMYNYTGEGNGATGSCAFVDIAEGDDVAAVPVLGDISQRNGRQAYRSLEWDTSQVVVLDFCNKYRDQCLKFFRVDSAPRAVIAGVFVSAGSSESLPSAYSPIMDKYGYIWTNGVNAGMRDPATGELAWNNRTFFVVPQLLPDDTCALCDAGTAPEIDCQSFLAIELHMYALNVPGDNQAWVKKQLPADWARLAPGLVGDYYVTFEYGLRLASGFNDDLVHPEMQCDVYSMAFRLDRPTLANVTTFPFQMTSGVYSCRVFDCASFLQRIANAWSNVELLYVICVNLIVFYVFARFTYNLQWRTPVAEPAQGAGASGFEVPDESTSSLRSHTLGGNRSRGVADPAANV